MTRPSFSVSSPLTSRLLRRILVLSLALIFALAGVRAWWEYRQTLTETDRHLAMVVATQSRSLASSLWDVDTKQISLQLEGIVSAAPVSYAAVVEHGRLVAERGARQKGNVLEQEVPLVRQHEGLKVVLGHLLLQADLSLARAQALRAAGISLAFSAFMATIVSLAIFWLIRSMVSRHLAATALHFQTVRVGAEEVGFEPLKLDKRWAGDELDVLCLAVNHMQERLASTYAQANRSDRQAKSLARFPEENPNPVLRVNGDGLLSYANQASRSFMNQVGGELGKPLPEPYQSVVEVAVKTGEVQSFEVEVEVEGGACVYAFVVRPVLPGGDVNLYGMDITLRKEAMDAMRRSLSEKEILLKEIHHRVKNNLQIISSLLYLQMEYVSLPQDKELFHESQKRIQAMALVHEELYGAEDLSSVNMRDYMPRLVERVLAGAALPVRLECAVDEVRLPVTRSIPCGLILNELVMNAVKHAFRPGEAVGRPGVLRVSLRREEPLLVLEVEDNGLGLPADFDIRATPTLGMTLVYSLTEQLSGSISAHSGPSGARFRLEMPCDAA